MCATTRAPSSAGSTSGPDALDAARDPAAGNVGRRDAPVLAAHAAADARLHPQHVRRRHRDDDLAGARHGIGHLRRDQDLGPAELLHHHRLHAHHRATSSAVEVKALEWRCSSTVPRTTPQRGPAHPGRVRAGGRFTLGVGIGVRDDDDRAAGVPDRGRGARMDEQMARLRSSVRARSDRPRCVRADPRCWSAASPRRPWPGRPFRGRPAVRRAACLGSRPVRRRGPFVGRVRTLRRSAQRRAGSPT